MLSPPSQWSRGNDFQQDLQDYRDLRSKATFTVVQTGGEAPFTIHFGEFHHNAYREESQFAKPDVTTGHSIKRKPASRLVLRLFYRRGPGRPACN